MRNWQSAWRVHRGGLVRGRWNEYIAPVLRFGQPYDFTETIGSSPFSGNTINPDISW
jgi:hypothetical protein